MGLFNKVIVDFEALLAEEALRREKEGGLPIGRPEVKILGQMSLLLDREAVRYMRLAGTVDVDALFHGNITTLELFRKALKMNNLVYDDLSGEIWLPKTARYETIHESDLSTIMRVDTFSALVSKAAKAPQKNRILIEQALAHYGTRLEELFRENGINLDQFQYEKKKARRR